jgi:hypothetical protein
MISIRPWVRCVLFGRSAEVDSTIFLSPASLQKPSSPTMTKDLNTIATKKRKISHSKLPPHKKDAKRVERPHVAKPANKKVTADPELDFSNATTFNHLHLSSALQKSITDMALSELSPLQRQAIPALLGGRDVSTAPLLTFNSSRANAL